MQSCHGRCRLAHIAGKWWSGGDLCERIHGSRHAQQQEESTPAADSSSRQQSTGEPPEIWNGGAGVCAARTAAAATTAATTRPASLACPGVTAGQESS